MFGVILARVLVPADFGLLVTMQIFTGVAGFVAGGGMGQALIQTKDVTERDFHTVFTVQLTLCMLIYGFFFAIAPWFAQWFNDPLYEPLLRISALSFLLRPFSNIPSARLQRDMRFKVIVAFNLVGMLVGSTASVLMALAGLGVLSLILGGMLGSAVYIVGVRAVAGWRPALNWDRKIVRRLGSYGVKFSINDILVYMKSQTGNFVISRILGPAMVGLYNKADSLSAIPRQVIIGSTYQTVFRGLSTVQDNKDLSKYMYLRTITLVTVYTMPFCVALWWLAEPFTLFVYGQKWAGAVAPLKILALTGLLLVGNPSAALIAAQNRLGRQIWINIETWILLGLGCLIGVRWGIEGVAWSVVVNRIYNNIRLFALARNCVGTSYRDLMTALWPAYLLNSILFLAMLGADWYLLGSMRASAPATYLILMGGGGALLYAGLFLSLPIGQLASEAERWKRPVRTIAPWLFATGAADK